MFFFLQTLCTTVIFCIVLAFQETLGSPVFVGYNDNQKEESSDYYVSQKSIQLWNEY